MPPYIVENGESSPESGRGILGIGSRRAHAVFVYNASPETSYWTRSHELGRIDMERFFDGRVTTKAIYAVSEQEAHDRLREIIAEENIGGALHTVRPISEKYRVFSRNHRICSVLKTERFGEIIEIEVGALQVGKITNHDVKKFSRMDEKGYFEFGGSTIIQLFKSGVIEVDGDIRLNTENGTETLVKTGERVGKRIEKKELKC